MVEAIPGIEMNLFPSGELPVPSNITTVLFCRYATTALGLMDKNDFFFFGPNLSIPVRSSRIDHVVLCTNASILYVCEEYRAGPAVDSYKAIHVYSVDRAIVWIVKGSHRILAPVVMGVLLRMGVTQGLCYLGTYVLST